MTHFAARRPGQCGFTIIETLITGAVLTALVAALLPMLGSGMYRSGMMVSANNLRRIADGCAAYEATWNGRQWSKTTDSMGHYDGCNDYRNYACPPTLILGVDESEGLWAYWISGNQPSCANWPGSCGNWPLIMPMAIGGTTGSLSTAANVGLGSWGLINARGLREYIADRFYDPVFYSPNDALIYQKLQAGQFNSPAEFAYQSGAVYPSTYGLSPAAIWGVGTFRAPRDGGFRAPDDYPQAYITPNASIATYPDKKTRLIEQRWCQQPPALAKPEFTTAQYYRFNSGAGSQPGTIFYDGHVSFVPMSTFAADDAMAAQQTGDGLWSRDTPYGANGVWSSEAIDGFYNSAHLLTTDGILGRDLLQAK